jgi:pantothenate kinase
MGRRLSRPELLDAARDLVLPRLAAPGRVLVGIAGAPGAGKSTLAQALAAEFATTGDDGTGVPAAVAVPMDGFHLSNVELARLGLADRKGAPETFDADGFVQLLRRIRAGEELVYAPAYSRVVHESVGGVIPVYGPTRLVIAEGNYLLVPDRPWGTLRELFDLTIYVEAPSRKRVAGLIRRQVSFGLPEPDALDWVYRSDEANARVVEASRPYADVVLRRS